MLHGFSKFLATKERGLTVDLVDFDSRDTDFSFEAENEIAYDFQLVHISLSSIFDIKSFSHLGLIDDSVKSKVLDECKKRIDAIFQSALRYNDRFGLMTFVTNIILPQRHTAQSLALRYSESDVSNLLEVLNLYIVKKANEKRNVFLIDIDEIAASIGKRYISNDVITHFIRGDFFVDDMHTLENNPLSGETENARIEFVPDMSEVYPSQVSSFFESLYDGLDVRSVLQ